jgi:hydroxypyruvate isomerase
VVEHGVSVALLNCNEGDIAAGERGFLNDFARRGELERDFLVAAELAQRIGAENLNLLVGCALPDSPVARQRREGRAIRPRAFLSEVVCEACRLRTPPGTCVPDR